MATATGRWARLLLGLGVGRTTAQNALRAAAAMGLVTIQERRREGQKNLPNVVRVVSREWRQWLARKGRAGEGAPSRL